MKNTDTSDATARHMVKRRGIIASWLALLVSTALLTGAMRWAHLPGALMLGPMIAAILVALYRPGAALPRSATVVAQAVIGCLFAHALSPGLLSGLAPQWPILVGVNLLTLFGIFGLGMVVTRLQWLPGTAGVWGMSPGAASAMVMLSEAHGSDKRLVAVMQYLRLLCCALSVIVVGTVLGTPHVGAQAVVLPGAQGTEWFGAIDPGPTVATLVLVIAGVATALILRKGVLALFVPIVGGIAIQVAGAPPPSVPPVVSATAFALIGWHIGLSFTRASLLHVARLVPRILLCIFAILVLCAGSALLLAHLTGTSFLTAYLALNPGGTDVIMVMAASISVDLPFVLAMQIARLVLVFALSPALGRLASGRHAERIRSRSPSGEAEALAKDVDEVI